MNLFGITQGMIGQVNPMLPATVQISAGWTTVPNSGGSRAPAYEAPGAITASITDGVLTVTAQASGKLAPGQTLTGIGVAAGTIIIAQQSGTPGGVGAYAISPEQTVASVAMTTAMVVRAQVQALTYKDLMHVDGLNLNGTRRAIYLYGKVQGVNRVNQKGGDLITIETGANAGVWLSAQVLEQWPDWCKLACTQQLNAA